MTRLSEIKAKVFFPTSRGKVGVCDFYDWWTYVKDRPWHVLPAKGARNKTYYVRHMKLVGGKSVNVLLHRLIVHNWGKFKIDHIDGNGLNNCRSNLRLCTHQENILNNSNKAYSEYPGVTKNIKAKKRQWVATYKQGVIGCYATEDEARKAYNFIALKDGVSPDFLSMVGKIY